MTQNNAPAAAQVDPEQVLVLGKALFASRTGPAVLAGWLVTWAASHFGLHLDTIILVVGPPTISAQELAIAIVTLGIIYAMRYITTTPIAGFFSARQLVAVPAPRQADLVQHINAGGDVGALPPAVRAMMPIAFLVLLGLTLSACIGNSAPAPANAPPPSPVQQLVTNVQTFTVDDLKAADVDAVAHNDTLAHMCYPVLIKIVQGFNVPVPGAPPVGAASAFQAARDIVKFGQSLAGGLSPDQQQQIAIGCGPLAMDGLNDINQVGLKLGIGTLAIAPKIP